MPKQHTNLAVNVQHVYKSFYSGSSELAVLKDISCSIYTNELLMIVGPSGCGKTTLLSIIAGTLSFDRGDVIVFGNDLRQLSDKETTEFRKKNIGFIFQQFHLIPTLSCLENVMIPLLLNGISMKEAEEKSAEILERVGLKGRENNFPYLLSGGQQQRVAIARALIHQPSLIICDEPTASLDAETGATILTLLKALTEQENKTVVVVTHDSRIFKYADRIVEMNDGKIEKHIEDPKEIQLSETIRP